MFVESIQLKNYRNYASLNLQLDSGTNIFYGDNAQGKTNILEAVYLSGTTRSHRGSQDREMIQFNQEEAHIRMLLNKNTIAYQVDMHLRKNKAKGVAVNGVPIRKARELFGIMNFVFFSPEDLNIIKNGPAERRHFLDLELCQLDRLYLNDLGNYNKIVTQRNKLLKDISLRPELLKTLEIWNLQLEEYGKRVIEKRRAFVEELNPLLKCIHGKLSGNVENISLLYEPNVESDSFAQALEKEQEKELKTKSTSVGPHRDDLAIWVNEIDLRKFGSQGQQRTAALSLKLAELYLVKEKTKDTPVLLLDDVLSELDSRRQMYLLDSIRGIQTLITCTGLDDFVNHQFQMNKVFRVVDGKVF